MLNQFVVGRRGRLALIVVPVVLIMGVAGAVFLWYAGQGATLATAPSASVVTPAAKPADATDAPASKPVTTSVDPASATSRLGLVRVEKGDKARAVVTLGRPATSEDFEGATKGTAQGILLREVVRQAVLIAARDELGLATRDEVLGEACPADPKSPHVEVSSVFREGGKSRATILRVDDGTTRRLFDQPLNFNGLPRLVEAAEVLSRTEFPEVLKTLGLDGKANPRRADAPMPELAEDRLARLGFPSLYAAIRSLHEAMRTDGESPARLAALARGYALLGVLSEFQWSAAHKVFKARALLYSQRLVARDPGEPFSLWNRAFVRALVGMHLGARGDLRQAWRRADARGDRAPKAPDWVPLITAYIRYDTKHLTTDKESSQGLAALLRLLAVEFPWSRSQTIPASQAVLNQDPDCFRAIDAICQAGGLSDLHAATVLGPQILDEVVPRVLQGIKTLPAAAREVIERKAGEPALVEALRRSGQPGDDPEEPSWAVLGDLIAETRFVHVGRRLSFMRNKWAVPVGEYWAEAHLSVAGHRFRLYLESLTLPPVESAEVLAAFLAKLDMGEIAANEYAMIAAFHGVNSPRARRPWEAAVVHADHVAHDLAEISVYTQNSANYPRRLLSVSPDSPFGRAAMIDRDWEASKDRLAGWANDPASGDAPALLAAIGRRYTELGRMDDAQQALRRYVEQSPEYWAYEMLANNEKARGDVKRWKEILDEFLKRGENSGLDYAKVQVEIAQDLMGRGQWSKAEPYAEAAAQTWAGWAMDCAGRCCEGMGRFDRAEFWFRNESERYPVSFIQWFTFCKRTGHGDLDAATQLALSFVKENAGGLSENEKALAVLLFDLANEPAEGVAFLQALIATPSPMAGQSGGRAEGWVEQMFLAHFADALGKRALRDACWAEVARTGPKPASAVAGLFRDTLAANRAKAFDFKAFDALLGSSDATARSYFCYFGGDFLARHGKLEDATKYWERCMSAEAGSAFFVSLLGKNALRAALNRKLPEDSHLYFLRGWFYRSEDRLELALKDLDEAMRLDPKAKDVLNLRGIVKRASGDLDGAAADFSKLIELAPDEPIGYLARAVTYVLLGEDDKAKADIERALAIAPKDGFAFGVKGLLLLAQGKNSEAEEAFDKGLSLNQAIGTPLETLKRAVIQKRGEKKPERAHVDSPPSA